MSSDTGASALSRSQTPTTRQIFAMTWPMALRSVMMVSIVIIDIYLVSSLGEEAVASIGIAGVISGLVMGINFAFANAMQIKVAQAFGTESSIELKTAFFSGLAINVGLVLAGIVLILVFGPMMLDRLAHSPEVAAGAKEYLSVFLLVMLAEAVSAALTSHFNGCGRTRPALYSFIISGPVNIGSSIVLIFGLYGFPELGLVGAAWGSFLGAALRLLYLAAVFLRSQDDLLSSPGWLDGGLVVAIRGQFGFSWPIAATFVSMTFAQQAVTAIYANLNIYEFAAVILILPWVQIGAQLSNSWTQSTGILLAQMLGKASPPAALDEFVIRAWRGVHVTSACVALVYALIILATHWIYVDLAEETRQILLSFLPILLVLPFPRASNGLCGNVLRASGDSKSSMNIHVASNWLFRVPMTALFVLVLDLPVAWVFAVLLFEELVKFPFFHRRVWSKEWQNLAK